MGLHYRGFPGIFLQNFKTFLQQRIFNNEVFSAPTQWHMLGVIKWHFTYLAGMTRKLSSLEMLRESEEHCLELLEVYSQPCQTSKMMRFEKKVHG